MKKIRGEYQNIKCPDLQTARDAFDIIKNKLENERNLDTLSIISKKEFYEDVENYLLLEEMRRLKDDEEISYNEFKKMSL